MESQSKQQTFEERAVMLVGDYLDNLLGDVDRDTIRVVWFCKTLQNWKAMIAHLIPAGYFFEVTHNGDKEETYIDAYKKFENVVVKD